MASEQKSYKAENLDADVLGILHKVVLSESYKYGGGFTILKELIQNADDARAEEMVLSYYDGSDESFEHPPFRQKGIFVYNDGVVKETEEKNDIKAIKSIAKNSKTDNDTIGKFGLGLKSIFHICETFYFFCHSDGEMEFKDFINPFINSQGVDTYHTDPDWNAPIMQSDVNKLIEKIESSIIGKRTSGITFFFPINPDEKITVSTARGGERQKIDPLHPFNKDDEENRQLIKNMVAATAILSKTSQGKLHKITYQIDETNKLVFDFDREQKKVVSWVNDSCREYQYAVEEHCVEESEFGNKILKKIRESNKEDTTKKEDVFKDSRVVFEFVRGDQAERNKGKLNIFHAVNLPLPQSQKKFDYEVDGREKNALENLEINSKYNYDLIIHAPFAIDSGRKEFVSSDKIFKDLKEYKNLDEVLSVAPQKYWNAVIYQLVILPNIPKFIKTANDEGIIDDDDIAKIVKQVRKSFGQDNLFCRLIASKYSLFNRFDVALGTNVWCLYEHQDCDEIAEDEYQEENKLKYIYVSERDADKNKKLCEGVISDDSCYAIVVPNDKPEYLAGSYLMSYEDGFDNESFTKTLEQFDGELLESARFLEDFIELNKNCLQNFSGKKIKDCDVRSAISRLKKILYERGRNGDFSCIDNAKILCEYLKENFEIPVYYIKKDSLEQDKWERLWSEGNPLMILPNSRNSSADPLANKEFASNEFRDWLTIEELITDREKHDILMDIVSVDTIRSLSWKEHCCLKIILVRDVEGKEECKSCSELVETPLFKLDEDAEIPQVMKCYQKLLGERKVYLISTEEKRLFLDSNNWFGIKCYACDNDGILKCIEDDYIKNHLALHRNLTSSIEVKNEFLKLALDEAFVRKEFDENKIGFYLFLLNGLSNREADYRSEEMGSPWKEILEKLREQGKISRDVIALSKSKERILDKCIQLTQRQNGFGRVVTKYRKRDCIDKLRECESDDLGFLQQEPFLRYREDIFKEIDANDDLFCRIPLHKTESGKYISFDPSVNFYNLNGIQFPAEFPTELRLVDILVMNENNSISSKLHDRFDKSGKQDRIWRGGRAVYDLIDLCEKNQLDASRYYNWIFKTLNGVQFRVGETEIAKVKSANWIPLNGGKSTSPESIALMIKFKDAVRGELKELIPTLVDEADVQWSSEIVSDSKRLSGDAQSEKIKKFVGDDELKENFIKDQIIKSNFNDYVHFESKTLWKSIVDREDLVKDIKTLKICRILLKEFPEESVWEIYQHLEPSCRLDYGNGVKFLNCLSSYCPGIFDFDLKQECEQLFFDALKKVVGYEEFDINDIERLPDANGNWKAPSRIVKSIYSGESYSDKIEEIPNDNRLKEEFYEIFPGCTPVQFIVAVAAEEISGEDAIKIVLNWNCNVNYKRGVLYLLGGTFREKAQIEDKVKHFIDILVDEFGSDTQSAVNLYSTRQKTMQLESLCGVALQIERRNDVVYHALCQENTLSLVVYGDADADIEGSVKGFFKLLLRQKYGINLDEKNNESCGAKFKEYADKLVGAIENPSQATIDGAQKRIQADVFATLRMLNVKHEKFKEFDNKYNDICFYDQGNANADDLRKQLIAEIKSSKDLRDDIFNKVSEKISQNQYSPQSILFELFQNADDCVEDLAVAGQENVVKKFSVTNQGGTLAVVHYGRPINAKCGDNEEKNARFKYDLLNMLSLSSSDKLREDGHTGKFGLGFKSIYTICREPKIYSGENHFKIIAGFYPENLDVSDSAALDNKETRFILDYNDVPADFAEIFKENADYVAIFSKQIKTIEFNDETFCPEYECICESEDYKICSVKTSKGEFLLINTGTAYKLLFKLDADHIVAVEKDCPKVWNLTPLQEEILNNLPFMINAPFVVDTGRLRLAYGGENGEIINKIAQHFADVMVALYRENPEYAKEILCLIYDSFQIEKFSGFAKTVLSTLFESNNVLVTGYGTVVDCTAKTCYAVDWTSLSLPSCRDDYKNELLKEFSENNDSAEYVLALADVKSIYESVNFEEIPQEIKDNLRKLDRDRRPDIYEEIRKNLGILVSTGGETSGSNHPSISTSEEFKSQIIDFAPDAVRMYYEKLYDESFYDHENQRIRESLILEPDENGDYNMNETWCILLLSAECQSLSFFNHLESSIKGSVQKFKAIGFVKDFVAGKNIQNLYDIYNANSKFEESSLRSFEMLMRLHKMRSCFSKFYSLLKELWQKPNFRGIEDLLTPGTDPDLDNYDIDIPSMERSMKFGMHFLLRELLRNEFWKGHDVSKIQRQAFMPKDGIKKLLGLSDDARSETIYEKIATFTEKFTEGLGNDGTYDIPFIMRNKEKQDEN